MWGFSTAYAAMEVPRYKYFTHMIPEDAFEDDDEHLISPIDEIIHLSTWHRPRHLSFVWTECLRHTRIDNSLLAKYRPSVHLYSSPVWDF